MDKKIKSMIKIHVIKHIELLVRAPNLDVHFQHK